MSFLIVGLAGTMRGLQAAGAPGRESVVLPYDVVGPSDRAAKLFQKRGDYVTAVLLYEAVLEQNPSDPQALKSMIDCHEALAKKEKPETPEVVRPREPANDESLADLPDLIPADKAATQQQAKNPANPLL